MQRPPGHGWHGLAELVANLHRHRAGPLPSGDLRERAAALAARTWGIHSVLARPLLVNLGALALLMDRLSVHRLSAGAIRLVHETDLHSLPGEPPRLLRRPWIVESRVPEREWLFGQTASLGGYPLDDAIYLIGLDWPDGVFVSRWRPRWEERDLDATIERDESPLVQDVDAHYAWSREAARFSLVLGLLLDAHGAPLAFRDERPTAWPQRGRSPQRAREPSGGWLVRHITLGEPIRLASEPWLVERAGERAEQGEGDDTARRPLSAALHPQVVPVRGHLKRQPIGPGRSQRKWIYVRSYEARRWIAPRPLRLEVRSPIEREEDT